MRQPLERPAGVAPSRPDGVAPFHLFNPPPGKLTLQAKLRNTASSSNDAPRYEFMLQLPRQRMRPAMRVLSDLGRATAWRLLPPSTLEQLAPTPAQLETEEGKSVPTLHPASAHAARLPSLPTDDGAASSHREEPPSSQGMNTLQPLPTRLEGAGLSRDLQPDGSLQFVMRDDPRNEYGVPRELGAVLIRGTQLRVIIPRVHADRTVAQFRVQAPADSLLRRYLSNTDLKHMTVLEAVLPDESSKAKLVLTSLDTKAVVLRVSLLADNHFSLEYTAPLSAFQALCVALTLAHRETAGQKSFPRHAFHGML